MKPDRSNYEIWLIDWLDGKLSREQAEDLKDFLEINPDIREEFSDLSMICFKPSDLTFSRKKDLGKSVADYSEMQFEHLCIANLEKELTPEQTEELKDIIEHDEIKRKIFDVYQKLRLRPQAYHFSRKNLIRRLTAGQKIFRMSVIGLSAAAAIALMIVISVLVIPESQKQNNQISLNSVVDTLIIERHSPFIVTGKSLAAVIPHEVNSRVDRIILNEPDRPAGLVSENSSGLNSESLPEIKNSELIDEVIVLNHNIEISCSKPSTADLVAWNPGYIPPLIDNRSNFAKSMAKFFHERILKDPDAGSRPVESFEVAVAGIESLNKFLGWEMALHKNTDENGEVRSYSFSSRLLKFKAPAKKSVNSL